MSLSLVTPLTGATCTSISKKQEVLNYINLIYARDRGSVWPGLCKNGSLCDNSAVYKRCEQADHSARRTV